MQGNALRTSETVIKIDKPTLRNGASESALSRPESSKVTDQREVTASSQQPIANSEQPVASSEPPTLQNGASESSLSRPENSKVTDQREVTASSEPPKAKRRTAGISIKLDTVAPQVHVEQAKEELPLDTETLRKYWAEMIASMGPDVEKLKELLKDKEPEMEGDDLFVFNVSNSFIEAEIKPYLVRILTYLRAKSGRSRLNCHTNVVYEEKEHKAYAPRDKYDVMVAANPDLEVFRILFPEVDY